MVDESLIVRVMVEGLGDVAAKVQELAARRAECEESGGHIGGEILVPYYRGRVLMTCGDCGGLYERNPTQEEIEEYVSMWNLHVNI